MRHIAILIAALLLPLSALAQDWEDRQVFGPDGPPGLRILSSTDTSFFAPIIEAFRSAAPEVSVEYLVAGTAQIDTIFRDRPDQYDIVISSAMDLQFKLANDGFAARLLDVAHPDWATWHDSLFAFTSEPAAIVVNRDALGDLPMPRSRQDMIRLLRDNPERFRGRVGTYDVRASGLGYLFATQDARASETYWRLMEVLGSIDAQLYCCSGQMIDDLRDGRLIIAYNVLGSYAQVRAEQTARLEVVLPSEFPTTMMRTVLASAQAPHPQAAERFLLHVLALQGQGDRAAFPLPPVTGPRAAPRPATINLDPALMTYLDRMKRAAFIREWESALVQDN